MFIAGLLASIACGVIGSLIVVKRVVFLSGGIAHATFGGIGLAYYLQYTMSWMWLDPLVGALIFAVLTAGIMSLPIVKSRLREDSTIGVLWVIGMALGVLFLNGVDRSEIIVQDPVSILFGNILLIQFSDLVLMGGLVIAILLISIFLFKDLQILTFDEEFARISGIQVPLLNFVLLLLVAFTTVVLIKVVGVVLVIAMLTIPASISGLFTKDLKQMMMFAVGIGLIINIAGLLLSLWYNLPPGSTIVLSLGIVFLLALIGKFLVQHVFSKTLSIT
ncbi:MAG: metal ABC transporter permease [Candidatus Thermoplasmatota archaeon]|nr:metal ABC transporter permease [Candidatus Thermoplasmatota archaeon]MBS3801898.1 metal ABC transporter permease [Candidatus Thermoplasmatota archaeon]